MILCSGTLRRFRFGEVEEEIRVTTENTFRGGKIVVGLTVGSAIMLITVGMLYQSMRSDVEYLKEQMKLRATASETQMGFSEMTRRFDRLELQVDRISETITPTRK